MRQVHCWRVHVWGLRKRAMRAGRGGASMWRALVHSGRMYLGFMASHE